MTDKFERITLLKKSVFFSQVNTDDLQFVAQSLEEESYFTGDRIFEINDNGDQLYIIVSGKIGISLSENPQDKNFIRIFGPGDCFGEMNLLDNLPRSATAHVVEDCIVLTLNKNKLLGLIMSYPEISIAMLRSLSLRLRDTTLKSTSH